MKCWICSADASTGEHMTKASDLRSMFGHVSQRAPLFMNTAAARNTVVRGLNAAVLKFKSQLCADCNNRRTQQHDRCWETLSRYLRERDPPVSAGMKVNLAKAFPGQIHRSMLNVHLYFVKLFGCLIVEHKIPLPIDEFSLAVLQGHPHPNVYLRVIAIAEPRMRRSAGFTEVSVAAVDGVSQYAAWLYHVGTVAVRVMYAVPGEHRRGLVNAWHPDRTTKRLQLASLEA